MSAMLLGGCVLNVRSVWIHEQPIC